MANITTFEAAKRSAANDEDGDNRFWLCTKQNWLYVDYSTTDGQVRFWLGLEEITEGRAELLFRNEVCSHGWVSTFREAVSIV